MRNEEGQDESQRLLRQQHSLLSFRTVAVAQGPVILNIFEREKLDGVYSSVV